MWAMRAAFVFLLCLGAVGYAQDRSAARAELLAIHQQERRAPFETSPETKTANVSTFE